MQKVIEFSITNEEKELIIEALKPHSLELMFHPHGSYVVNALIEYVDHKRIMDIIECALANVDSLALNQHGLCVLKKMMNSKSNLIIDQLTPKVLKSVPGFVNNQYGNYILQHLLTVATDKIKLELHGQLKGNYSRLACQKFASNVVEKCLVASPIICSDIVEEFIADPSISIILQDSYGNYVMQSALNLAPEEQVTRLKSAIRPALVNLRKKIQKKWERLLEGRSPKLTSSRGGRGRGR